MKLKLNSTASVYLWALASVILTYFIFGFYYERYEPLPVFLFSGIFTPGMVYDDMFYLAYIGLAKLFGNLYYYFPNIPWISLIQYALLLVFYIIIGQHLRKRIKNNVVLVVSFLLLSALYSEFYVLHVMTRISFLFSFIALFKIMDIGNQNKGFIANIWYYSLFIIAVLIRAEPAAVAVLLLSVYYFLVINNEYFFPRLVKSIKIFVLPALICLITLTWVVFSAKTSNEFYIQIEPEVEYELVIRNNIIPIEAMQNQVDSMRYYAINNNLWSDATTNNADFLRFLIDKNETSKKYLIDNAVAGIEISSQESMPVSIFFVGMFLLLFLALLFNKPISSLYFVLFNVFFALVLFAFSYETKMVVTSFSPIMFSMGIIYLFLLLEVKKGKYLILYSVFSIFVIVLQFGFLKNISNQYRDEYKASKKLISALESSLHNRNLFIDADAMNLLFKGFQPFEIIHFENIEKIYPFDCLYFIAVQPYKSFLERECNCDPNNFREYFKYIVGHKDEIVFLTSEERIELHKDYMHIVHNIDFEWKLYGDNEEFKQNNLEIDPLSLYRIE